MPLYVVESFVKVLFLEGFCTYVWYIPRIRDILIHTFVSAECLYKSIQIVKIVENRQVRQEKAE